MTYIATQAFTDPDSYYESIGGVGPVEGIVTARGNYHATLTCVNFSRLWMRRGEDSLAQVSIFTPRMARTTITFAADQDQPAYQIAGEEKQPDEVTVVSLGSSQHVRTSAAARWGAVTLPPEDFAALGQRIIGRELTPPSFTHQVKPSKSAMSRLRSLHEAVAHLAKKAPDILASPEVARAMEEALQEATVFCLASAEPVHVGSAHRHHARIMQRLEEALHANSNGPVYMSELCAAVGASYSTLRDCCQEHFGMSPKRYLWLRRMHLARRDLCRADPEKTSVTEIATSYGFWELGRFAVAYSTLFGESPSMALRRPPDDPKPGENAEPPWQFIKSA
jgi:AraC-like DNA-binding protein